MAETKTVHRTREDHEVVDRARDFWGQYNRPITIVALAIILIGGGWLAYKNFVQEPNQRKASEAMFKAEDYFRRDSLNLALNGDRTNPGFIKIIDKYGGTKSGNLAKFYAGASYLQLGDFAKAEKYLEDFDTDAKQVQARAYKLLGDAYAEQGKNKDALDAYKKAAHHFEEDKVNAADYYFLAAYFAETVVKDQKEAISLYKDMKAKFPNRAFDADKYLARLGVYSDDK